MKNLKAAIAFLVLFAVRTDASECEDLSSLAWLLGAWQATTKTAVITESWQRVSSETFEGVGTTLSGEKQTRETMRLLEMDGEIFYLAKVKQNPLPVAFKLDLCQQGQATFVNQSHDFPKRLVYTITEDGLHVDVSDGKGSGFELHFVHTD